MFTFDLPRPHLFVTDMDAVKKAASGAVDTIRNSPLFRRKFGTQNRADCGDEPRPLSPERDTTPFVQGINFQVYWLAATSLNYYHFFHCLLKLGGLLGL